MFLQNLTNEEKSIFLYELWEFIQEEEAHDKELSLKDYYSFSNSYAISKAELSQLTEEEALSIFHNNYTHYLLDEDSERFINDFIDEYNEIINWNTHIWKSYYKIQKLHDKLEYNNIVNAMKYTDIENNRNLYDYILNNGITKELLIKLHTILTYRMDDLFLNRWVPDYSPYMSWELRQWDYIKVWQHSVWLAKDIEDKIELIGQKSLNIKNIFDVFEIHGIMYEAHIFNNGNKRISRIIESLLIKIYNFAPSIPISYGYYIYNDFYINNLVNLVIDNKDFKSWANFAYASALLAWLEILYKINISQKEFFFDHIGLSEFFPFVPKKDDFFLKELEKTTSKKRSDFLPDDIIQWLLDKNVLDIVEYYDQENNKTKDLYVVRYDLEGEDYVNLLQRYKDVYKLIISYSTYFANQYPKYTINQELKDYKRYIETSK